MSRTITHVPWKIREEREDAEGVYTLKDLRYSRVHDRSQRPQETTVRLRYSSYGRAYGTHIAAEARRQEHGSRVRETRELREALKLVRYCNQEAAEELDVPGPRHRGLAIWRAW